MQESYLSHFPSVITSGRGKKLARFNKRKQYWGLFSYPLTDLLVGHL